MPYLIAVQGHHSHAEKRDVEEPTSPHRSRNTISTRTAWPFQRCSLSVGSPSGSLYRQLTQANSTSAASSQWKRRVGASQTRTFPCEFPDPRPSDMRCMMSEDGDGGYRLTLRLVVCGILCGSRRSWRQPSATRP